MKNNKLKIILSCFLVVCITTLTVVGVVFYTSLDHVKTVKISKTDKDLGIKKRTSTESSTTNSAAGFIDSTSNENSNQITNIALFGVDTRTGIHEAKHSDSIMVLTIDEKHKKLKLSSFMRDLYVSIDGHKNNKLTSAYAYGGPQLAIKTLNENFNLDIKDYVTANFSGLSDIIDAVGGVKIDVKEKELEQVNKYMREVANLKGERATPVTHGGYQLLNGNQAQAYARIRKVGNGDFERTERQKTVLLELFNRIKSKNVIAYPTIASKLLSCLETSMDKAQMLQTGSKMLGYGISNVDWFRFPVDGYVKSERINKIFYLTADLQKTTEQVHSFIYDGIKTAPLTKKLAATTRTK